MTEKLTFEVALFDHLFVQELALVGDIPPEIRAEWEGIVARYRRSCWEAVKGWHYHPARQAANCLKSLEDLPYEFDRFMLRMFDRDEKLGRQMYRDNWWSLQRGYFALTAYCAFGSQEK